MRSFSHPFRVRVIRPTGTTVRQLVPAPVRRAAAACSPRSRPCRSRVAACAIPRGGGGRRHGDAQFRQRRHRRGDPGGRRDHRPQLRRRPARSRARSTSSRRGRCRVGLVYPTLLSALRLQGFAAIEGDGDRQDRARGRCQAAGRHRAVRRRGPGGDRLVTQVITLRFESAAQLVNVLRPLITPNNTITAYPATNALIITDYAEQPEAASSGSSPRSTSRRRASRPWSRSSTRRRSTCVAMLNRLVDRAGRRRPTTQQRVTLVADPRSNSIIIRSDNSGRAARVRQLIEQLDTPGRAGGNIYIIYLKNAEATRVAQTLRALLSGGGDSRRAGRGHRSQPAASAPARPADGAPVARRRRPSLRSPRRRRLLAPAASAIQADPTNNALIIQAPEPVYNNLRAIIDKLDIRRAQVYVEALIVEVSADRAARVRHPVAGALRHRQERRPGLRRHQLRRARQRQQHHRRGGQPGHRRARASTSASSTAS